MYRILLTTLIWSLTAIVGVIGLSAYLRKPAAACLIMNQDIDFGDQPPSQTAVHSITLKNAGERILLIEGIRSTCSCAGFEVWEGGSYKRVDSLSIGPGDKREVYVRQGVNGSQGDILHNYVAFRTNDPLRSEARVHLRVRVAGGVFARPQAVAIGVVREGESARHIVDLYHRDNPATKVSSVVVSDPGIEVRSVGEDGLGRFENPAMDGCHRIQQWEVLIKPRKPGSLESWIEVKVDDERLPLPIRIPIVGMISKAIEVTPPAAILKRDDTGGTGGRAFSCLCIGEPDLTLKLRESSVPKGVLVRISPIPMRSGHFRIDLSLESGKNNASGPQEAEIGAILLDAVAGGRRVPVEIPYAITKATRVEE